MVNKRESIGPMQIKRARNQLSRDTQFASRPPSRQRLLPLVLACAYAIVALAIAFLVGNFLYDIARSYSMAAHSLPNLELSEAVPALQGSEPNSQPELPGNSSNIASAAETTIQFEHPRINILLMGTDEREGETGPPRTDTLLLLTLDLEHRTAGMISLPRDLWVPIPGYDLATKINTAYAMGERRGYPGGGAQLVKDTVSSFIGRPVEYYVKINFNGFVRFIDLIGGIDLVVPDTIYDDQYPTADHGYQTFYIEAGNQHLDGETALKYVRTRNTDSDYKRAGRQQQMIQAVLDKVLAADMIPTLLARAPQLMSTMSDSFSTDLPWPTALELANYIRGQQLQEPLRRLVLDSNFGEETYSDEGAWILVPNRDRVREALGEFFSISQLNVTQSPSTALASSELMMDLPASQDAVRLEILNGTGYPGVAAHVRDLLQQDGWQVVAIGDADRSDYRRTLIVNYTASEAMPQNINADLSLPPNLPILNGLMRTDNIDMRIVIGQDFLSNVMKISTP